MSDLVKLILAEGIFVMVVYHVLLWRNNRGKRI